MHPRRIMPRRRIHGASEIAFHVFNRAAWKRPIFDTPASRDTFVDLLVDARRRVPIRLLTFCVMPTHFHLVVWPADVGQLPAFMHWLTGTHAQRWRSGRGTTGGGAVYQGRYKAVPTQTDRHLLRLCRYVERNPVRAGLVLCGEGWRWSGLGQRQLAVPDIALDEWPVDRPDGWADIVNRPESERELLAIRECLIRSRPMGDPEWRDRTSRQLGLATRGPGRPRREVAASAGDRSQRGLWEE
jgi:putative transposase